VILLAVPSGEHVIEIEYASTPLRRAAGALSALALLALGMLALGPLRRRS
jgi:hypothetical protein